MQCYLPLEKQKQTLRCLNTNSNGFFEEAEQMYEYMCESIVNFEMKAASTIDKIYQNQLVVNLTSYIKIVTHQPKQ